MLKSNFTCVLVVLTLGRQTGLCSCRALLQLSTSEVTRKQTKAWALLLAKLDLLDSILLAVLFVYEKGRQKCAYVYINTCKMDSACWGHAMNWKGAHTAFKWNNSESKPPSLIKRARKASQRLTGLLCINVTESS